MLYLFTPLDKHFDKGFGAVASSFHGAADALRATKGGSVLNGSLPIGFLYRHAIELYLKGAIIIIHKHLKLPFGDHPSDGEPYVQAGEKWRRMYCEHRIQLLYDHLRKLLSENGDYLERHTRTNWNFPDGFERKVSRAQEIDASSTYFRYPVTGDDERDTEKSSARETTVEEVMARAMKNKQPMKTMVVVDGLDNVKKVFVHDDSSLIEMTEALREVAETLSGCHAALMGELIGLGV